MRGDINGEIDTDRRSAGPFSDGGLGTSGTFTFGGADGEGQEGTGSRGGELSTDPLSDFRGSDTRDRTTETRKKPGPKPGAKRRAPVSAERLAAARRKFADFLAGAVGFGFSWYGGTRAKGWVKKGFPLQMGHDIYQCYQLTDQETHGVGEPLADTFVTWFPKYVEPAAQSIDPGLAVIRTIGLLQKISDREAAVVATWHSRLTSQQSPSTNGAHQEPTPPGDATNQQEGVIEEWMKTQSPQPEEILT